MIKNVKNKREFFLKCCFEKISEDTTKNNLLVVQEPPYLNALSMEQLIKLKELLVEVINEELYRRQENYK